MSLLHIGEIFGYVTAIPLSGDQRKKPFCPFRGNACSKQGKISPLGICTLSDGSKATVTCPVRFLEGKRVLVDAARLAFGPGREFIAVPEVRLLEIPAVPRNKKIGKVDFLLAEVSDQRATNFAALEIQSVYISGRSIRPAFNQFLADGSMANPLCSPGAACL